MYRSGTGSLLHAFMCGLQGMNPARWVKVPSVIAIKSTVKTAIGRRFQLFSPSPERNGRSSRPVMASTGPISNTGVSSDGGSIEPQEKVIRLWDGLDDRRIWPSGWPKWTEEQRARGNRQDNERCEEHVFPDGVGNEGGPVFFRKRVIFGFVACSSYNASRHRPFVNAQLQHHQYMETHEADQ